MGKSGFPPRLVAQIYQFPLPRFAGQVDVGFQPCFGCSPSQWVPFPTGLTVLDMATLDPPFPSATSSRKDWKMGEKSFQTSEAVHWRALYLLSQPWLPPTNFDSAPQFQVLFLPAFCSLATVTQLPFWPWLPPRPLIAWIIFSLLSSYKPPNIISKVYIIILSGLRIKRSIGHAKACFSLPGWLDCLFLESRICLNQNMISKPAVR